MSKDELLQQWLPHSPQMIVTGKPLTTAQALTIIRRTDQFFLHISYDARPTLAKVKQIIRMPNYPSGNIAECTMPDGEIDLEKFWKNQNVFWEKFRGWQEDWGVLDTGFVKNSWISREFAGGFCGWCHPDGMIGFTDNLGVYPAVSAVYEDWRKIAREFPFLEAEATLMNNSKRYPAKPVVSFLIRDGEVDVVDPKRRNIHKENRRENPENYAYSITGEPAISMKQIRVWGEEFLRGHLEYSSGGVKDPARKSSPRAETAAGILAKGAAAYISRNGSIENRLADGGISEGEMAGISRGMVERLAEIFFLIGEERTNDLLALLAPSLAYAQGLPDAKIGGLEGNIENGRDVREPQQKASR